MGCDRYAYHCVLQEYLSREHLERGSIGPKGFLIEAGADAGTKEFGLKYFFSSLTEPCIVDIRQRKRLMGE